MLIRIDRLSGPDGRKLMDLYREGNLENAEYFYPEITDREAGIRKVEEEFLRYIRDDFLKKEGNAYYVLEADSVWVSALRLYRVKEGLYYIEALETHPDLRKRGYASMLLKLVTESLREKEDSFRVRDCVRKRNLPSVKTHLKSGFRIVSEEGFDLLTGETDPDDFSFEYEYHK